MMGWCAKTAYALLPQTPAGKKLTPSELGPEGGTQARALKKFLRQGAYYITAFCQLDFCKPRRIPPTQTGGTMAYSRALPALH